MIFLSVGKRRSPALYALVYSIHISFTHSTDGITLVWCKKEKGYLPPPYVISPTYFTVTAHSFCIHPTICLRSSHPHFALVPHSIYTPVLLSPHPACFLTLLSPSSFHRFLRWLLWRHVKKSTLGLSLLTSGAHGVENGRFCSLRLCTLGQILLVFFLARFHGLCARFTNFCSLLVSSYAHLSTAQIPDNFSLPTSTDGSIFH